MGRRVFHPVLVACALMIPLAAGATAVQAGGMPPGHGGAIAAVAASPSQTVWLLVSPFLAGPTGKASCDPVTGKTATCPLTSRARAQFNKASQQANAFCRCQNTPTKITLGKTRLKGTSAQVDTNWFFGGKLAYRLTWVTVHRGGKWLVNDQFCTGRPKTTVYKLPAGPCG